MTNHDNIDSDTTDIISILLVFFAFLAFLAAGLRAGARLLLGFLWLQGQTTTMTERDSHYDRT